MESVFKALKPAEVSSAGRKLHQLTSGQLTWIDRVSDDFRIGIQVRGYGNWVWVYDQGSNWDKSTEGGFLADSKEFQCPAE